MQCLNPFTASLSKTGSITFSTKDAIPGLLPFQLDCRKCIPCRLNQAREKAIRAVHEAKMHENSIFLTLTYNDESLPGPRLVYEDWQKFIRKLRKTTDNKLPCMVTGEYGEKSKRPHWHALIFNYRPSDCTYKYTTDLGHKVETSEFLTNLWAKGIIEFGDITLESAGYVCRYAAKKLVHGKDQDHDYHPIHKTSSRYGIGRSWIEKYWEHTFNHGFVVLQNGQTHKIPRYYCDWAKKHQPDAWFKYITTTREKLIKAAELKQRKEELDWISQIVPCPYYGSRQPILKKTVKQKIMEKRFKQLHERLKL